MNEEKIIKAIEKWICCDVPKREVKNNIVELFDGRVIITEKDKFDMNDFDDDFCLEYENLIFVSESYLTNEGWTRG